MGRHDRNHNRAFGCRDGRDFSSYGAAGDGSGPYPAQLPRRVSWAAVIAALTLWTLLAWFLYAVTDPVLGWLTASAGLVLESGKSVATEAGVGKEVGTVVDSLKTTGLIGQVIALLHLVLKPTIITVWALGAPVIIVAPLILRKLGGRLSRLRRH